MSILPIAPFDYNFNDAVTHISHVYVPHFTVSDNAPSTYRQLKAHLDAGNAMVVAREGSENTIFADPNVNLSFRAWHDWCHWKGGYDFSLYGESATCCMQIDQLFGHCGVTSQTQKWSQYLIAEVIGQRQYYEKYGTYIGNQRAFVRAYLASPTKALASRW